MKSTYTLPDYPLTFARVLRFTYLDGGTVKDPIVRYEAYDEELGATIRGIALVVRDGREVIYCDSFINDTFAGKWLYTRHKRIYQSDFVRQNIAIEVESCDSLEVYILSEEKLKAQLGQATNPWVNAASIEEKIIADQRPIWNAPKPPKKDKIRSATSKIKTRPKK